MPGRALSLLWLDSSGHRMGRVLSVTGVPPRPDRSVVGIIRQLRDTIAEDSGDAAHLAIALSRPGGGRLRLTTASQPARGACGSSVSPLGHTATVPGRRSPVNDVPRQSPYHVLSPDTFGRETCPPPGPGANSSCATDTRRRRRGLPSWSPHPPTSVPATGPFAAVIGAARRWPVVRSQRRRPLRGPGPAGFSARPLRCSNDHGRLAEGTEAGAKRPRTSSAKRSRGVGGAAVSVATSFVTRSS